MLVHHLQREKAWGIARYPCIGRWRFLYLPNSDDPHFHILLRRLKDSASGDALLDLGCCMAQVLRQFAYYGVDGSRLFGTDLHRDFIDVGYELFRDSSYLKATFVTGDMLDPADKRLRELDGKITIVHAGSFWHLFNWDQQVVAAVRLVKFLKPGRKNAIIYGKQVGTVRPLAMSRDQVSKMGTRSVYLHDQKSFQRLWDQIGIKTRTRWRVELDHIGEVPMQIPGLGHDARISRYGIYQIG
jgi:SAM-dependent methyltransferase